MPERTRRLPQRPLAFWAVFAGVAVLGLGAAGLLYLRAEAAPAPGLYATPANNG